MTVIELPALHWPGLEGIAVAVLATQLGQNSCGMTGTWNT